MNSKTRLGENWGQSGMRSEWKKYALEDVCEKIYSGGTPSTKHPEYWNGNIKWLSSGETSQRFVYDTERKITQLGVDNSSTKKATKGCTVIATAGQGYTRGQASFLMTDTYMNQSVIACKANEKIIDPLFLYYNLDNRYEEFRLLSDGTSTRGGLSGWIVKRIEIQIPCIAEQCTIARILKSLDEKIEVNNKINKNLEQQAQAIFDNMFPNISNGSCTIADYIKPKRGQNLLSKNAILGDVPVIAGGLEPSTYHNVANTQSPVLAISASGANAGYVSLWNTPIWSSDSSFIDSSMTGNVYFWYVLLKKRQKEIFDAQTGSAQPHIYPRHISSISIPSLDVEEVHSYTSIVTPIFEMMGQYKEENTILASTRDALLPKLMSGELDVSDINL